MTSHRDPRDVLHSVRRIGMAWEAMKNTAFFERLRDRHAHGKPLPLGCDWHALTSPPGQRPRIDPGMGNSTLKHAARVAGKNRDNKSVAAPSDFPGHDESLCAMHAFWHQYQRWAAR